MDEADDEIDEQGKNLWDMMAEAAPARAKTWKTSVDVQQPGFSDTHATGNQQRFQADGHGRNEEKTEVRVVHLINDASPTQGNSPEEVLSACSSRGYVKICIPC